MMLESVPEGGVVGLPVPLGFDDVMVLTTAINYYIHFDLLIL
jgi:hypothetical protein